MLYAPCYEWHTSLGSEGPVEEKSLISADSDPIIAAESGIPLAACDACEVTVPVPRIGPAFGSGYPQALA
jgi:hypothetical protein